MKKNVLIIAICAIFAIGLTSCGKPKTATQLLTDKGWVLTEATVTPAYQVDTYEFINDCIKDGWFKSWELDDIILFDETGGVKVDPGKLLPTNDWAVYKTLTSIGTWSFDKEENPEYLSFQLPWWYNDEYTAPDAAVEKCTIVILNETTLRLRITFDYPEYVAKVNHQFTLEFKHK
ncbi:MAG: hypothetical protein LBU51_04230 [Bacteroidales bacterium]|jgi:hypothetical protein|nr:hypothetical protein [Bacteroidales bacterium]